MIFRVDLHTGVPVYRQLMDQVRFQVASGVLRPGDPLPSTRGLSSQLGVNPMTVSKAFSLLEREGLLERRPGLPLVVRARPPEEVATSKLDRLRESLAPAVAAVRQLDVAPDDAVALLRSLLNQADIDSTER